MRQTILTILLIVFILATGFVWFAYLRSSPPAGPPVTPGAEEERLAQYRELRNLTPDTALFSDPAFQGLRPARTPPPAGAAPKEGQGRANPFAPF